MDTHYEAINWGLGEVNWFRRAEGELARTLKDSAARQTQGHFDWLEGQLGERAWFNGETFGWGDLCVAPFIGTSLTMGPDYAPPVGAGWRTGSNGVSRGPRCRGPSPSRGRSTSGPRTSSSWSPRACSSANIATIDWNG